jgi:hypothetical protein
VRFGRGCKTHKNGITKGVTSFFLIYFVCVCKSDKAEVFHIHEGVLAPSAVANELRGGRGLTPSAFANEPGRGDFTPSA